jgi:hypothetical protein
MPSANVAARSPTIPRRRGDDAAPLRGREAGDEIQSAAHLEGSRRVVVLVPDEDRQPRSGIEKRMAQCRRRLERAIDDSPGGV